MLDIARRLKSTLIHNLQFTTNQQPQWGQIIFEVAFPFPNNVLCCSFYEWFCGQDRLPQMEPTFLKSLSDFLFRTVVKSMLGPVIWPGLWILRTKFFRQISIDNCSNLLTFFSVKLMWKSQKQIWYLVQSSAQCCVLTNSSPLGVGQAPVENSWGTYKSKNVAQKKLA